MAVSSPEDSGSMVEEANGSLRLWDLQRLPVGILVFDIFVESFSLAM